MVKTGPESLKSDPQKPDLPLANRQQPRWAQRDWIAAAVLFVATVAVVLWQNAHVAVFFDLSYILNTAQRIAAGQVPYRDFPLAHSPLTFFVQAAIIRLTGRVFFHHILYAALIGGLGSVLTWRIALRSLRDRVSAPWMVALLIAAPLTVLGIYSIIPTPEYDSDCAFSILVALWFLQRLEGKTSPSFGFAAGAALSVPLFFKQNMGLPFLLAAIAAVLFVLALEILHPMRGQAAAPQPRALLLSAIAGAAVALAAAALAIHFTVGLGNYFYWTIAYAGRRRLPGFADMLGVYRDPSLFWTLPCAALALILLWQVHRSWRSFVASGVGSEAHWPRIAAFILLAAPFLFTLASLIVYYDDPDSRGDSLLSLWPLLLLLAAALAIANLFRLRRQPSLRAFMPLVILAAIHGTFMSQQLWGSTYAIWPLLIVLIADLLAFLDGFLARTSSSRWLSPALASLISFTLLVCGGLYTASEERISYVWLPAGAPAHSALPVLAGLSTPGPYLAEFDELLRYAQANIPFDDGIVLIPGEEPFFFATGRVPRFPSSLFDSTTDPYSPAEVALLVRSRNIRWLIVKRDLQIKEDTTPQRAATMQLLMQEFTLEAHLRGYDVYRLKPAT